MQLKRTTSISVKSRDLQRVGGASAYQRTQQKELVSGLTNNHHHHHQQQQLCSLRMSDLLRLLLLSSWSLVLCDNTENISVKAGQNVILECRAQVSLNDVITLLKWKKPELKSESYVFFFRDNHFNGDYQDERFLGRVQLSDQQMKDGDVSVVLKNVTADDSGTYECNVKVEHNGQRRVRRHGPKPVSVVKLTVTEPGTTGAGEQGGDKGGHSGLIAAGAVIGVIGVIVTGLILVLIRRRKNSDQPAGDAEEERLRETPELS